ncbi:MAG: DUF1116 domain-containing protein [Stellaceae bacterium]
MNDSLFERAPAVVNLGIADFNRSITKHGGTATQIEWSPVGGGDPDVAWVLARLTGDAANPDVPGSRMDRANVEATRRMLDARPMLIDVALHARLIWSEMSNKTLFHAGAPIAWDRMCGPMQGSMIGALLYEGWADSIDEARDMLARGAIDFVPCHHKNAVGPMSGIISPSMPVFVVKNATHGNCAYTNMSEGIGEVLRFGATSPKVIKLLQWMEQVLALGLKRAINAVVDGIDLKNIQSQALLMGDECHSRNTAATLLFLAAISGPLAESGLRRNQVSEIFRFLAATPQFFLNLSMVSSKATMDAAHGIKNSSIVTAIARNGVTTAIRVSGLGGKWFEAPSETPIGLYFPGFAQQDANPDLGDSAIAETAGFGGFSLAASPALVKLVGGTVATATDYSREMYAITETRNPSMSLPLLDFQGAPNGIEVRKVVDTCIRPVITTGIAHKQSGVGQIGAGIVRPPMACFTQALVALAGAVDEK